MNKKIRNALYGFVPFIAVIAVLLLQSSDLTAASSKADITIVPVLDQTSFPGEAVEYVYLIANNNTISSTTFALVLNNEDSDWDVTFNDESDVRAMRLESGNVAAVTVVHRPPPNVGNTDSDTFELVATFADGSSLSTSNATTVEAEYGFLVSADDETQTGNPRERLTYRLQIENVGLSRDPDLSITVENADELRFETNVVRANGAAGQRLDRVPLPIEGTLFVEIEVIIPWNEPDESMEIATIVIASEGLSAGMHKREIMLTTTVENNATATPTLTRTPTYEPTETATPTSSRPTLRPTSTRQPTSTAEPTRTLWPTRTPFVLPTDTPWPTNTRWPTRTPIRVTATPSSTPNLSEPLDPLDEELAQLLDEIGELLTRLLLEELRDALEEVLAERDEDPIVSTPYNPCADGSMISATHRRGQAVVYVVYNEDFTAVWGENGVTLSWSTEAEDVTAGFVVQRITSANNFAELNDMDSFIDVSDRGEPSGQLVSSMGNPATGATYQVVDQEVRANDDTTYYYRLIEVEQTNDFRVLDVIVIDSEAFETATPTLSPTPSLTPSPTSTATPTPTPCFTTTPTDEEEELPTATPPTITVTHALRDVAPVSFPDSESLGVDVDELPSAVDVISNSNQTHSLTQAIPLIGVVVTLLTITLYSARLYSGRPNEPNER